MRRFSSKLSAHTLLLWSGLLILSIAGVQMGFTWHILSSSKADMAAHNETQFVQSEKVFAVRSALLRLEVAATRDTTFVARKEEISGLLHVLNGSWSGLSQAIPGFDQRRLEVQIRAVQRHAKSVIAVASNHEQLDELKVQIRHSYPLLDGLEKHLLNERMEADQKNEQRMVAHQRQTMLLTAVLILGLVLTIGWFYRTAIAPLRELGQLATRVGEDAGNAEELVQWPARLSELCELRDVIYVMVKNLTLANGFVTDSVKQILELTLQTSAIAAQVRAGVVEENAIGKGMFEDVREMRVGDKQVRETLSRALELLSTAEAKGGLFADDIEEVRQQLLIVSDITNAWDALGKDLERVLDGFDVMVVDRMTLANEIEQLTAVMSTRAREMTLRMN
jgi:hypothetical protein